MDVFGERRKKHVSAEEAKMAEQRRAENKKQQKKNLEIVCSSKEEGKDNEKQRKA